MTYKALALVATLAFGAWGCSDYLTAGETSRDPNRPVEGTTSQYFVAVQSNIWASHTGDMSRITSMWAQHFRGDGIQYGPYDNYLIDEQTTNSAQTSLYITGGLVDVRKAQESARAADDTLFLGVTQVQEVMLMGLAADVFGDLEYTEALLGTPNPKLDPQIEVYDSLQVLLTRAIGNLTGAHDLDVGPGSADLVYGGNRDKWRRLAYTLKARYYMHTAEERPASYDSALKYAPLGILDDADDYKPVYSGSVGEQNMWYQFLVEQRPGYMIAGPTLDSILRARNDPRRSNYFDIEDDTARTLSEARLDERFAQPIASAAETRLIWAEAAYRTGATSAGGVAATQLNAVRADVGLPNLSVSGQALLREILTEKYIATFQLGVEAWMDYRRTCSPNLAPRSAGGKMPGRLYYDSDERQTNTNIPQPGTAPNGLRNGTDKVNATSDMTGTACLAGA